MRINRNLSAGIVFFLAMVSGLAWSSVAYGKPNIIYILADDLGYGDLSVYGQKTLVTPNLDRLAREGLRFTRHYAGSTVCAPSRCVLVTGLHTGHSTIRGNGPGQLTSEDVTFATLMKREGYATGCFGKWGIGNPPPLDDPSLHGFNEFYGYVNMYHAHNYYPEFLVKNGLKVPLRNKLFSDWKEKRSGPREGAGVSEVAVDYAPKLIADAALDFIRRYRDGPFLLYYALNIPHANNEAGGESRVDNNGMRVPGLGRFKGENWPIQEKGFAQMIEYIDQDVGQIVGLLEELAIDENTLVMFSSDNGPHQEGGHQVDFFDSNRELRGWKRDLYEGGVRVPMIAWWPGAIAAGRSTDLLSGFQDVFPTVLELAGVQKIPANDGISMVPTLVGKVNEQEEHEHLYWEFYEKGGKVAVVTDRWKGMRLDVVRNPEGPIELYDLSNDVEEQVDVSAKYPDVVAKLAEIMRREHSEP